MLQTLLTICACKTTCDTPLAGSRCTRGHVNPLQLAAPSCALPAGPCNNDELLQRLLVTDEKQPAPVLRPRSNTSTGISLYELLRPSPQESVAPDSQEMRLFIRADAQLFTGAMQAMAPLDASSGFLMCFRSFARHRAGSECRVLSQLIDISGRKGGIRRQRETSTWPV